MPASYPELEIGLHRFQADTYQVELRFSDPDSDAELAQVRAPCALDPDALLPLQLEPEGYGQALVEQVFAAPAALDFFRQVRAIQEAKDSALRLRLLIGPTAAELHTLRWELLRDPETHQPLASSERVLFSRFMLSGDWRPVRLRRQSALRALVAVAAPSDLDQYPNLAPVDIDGEVTRAGTALQGIATEVLGQNQALTLDALTDALRDGIDILYLVAHGALHRTGGPILYLQDAEGRTRPVPGDDLAQRIAELREPPRLIVLASCESAAVADTGSDSSPQAALAPRLAAAGVPAIIAMQGKIAMQTVAEAMPKFFQELVKDGQIDRAMGVARGRVRERADAWMPALFLRLRGGRLWYQPGFRGARTAGAQPAEDDPVKWQSLVNDIERKRFTPIIGWGLAEAIYGSPRDLAERLAQANRFPLAPQQRSDLPQVSDYLYVSQRNSSFPLDQVKDQLAAEVLARHRDLPGIEALAGKLSRLIKRVAEHHARDLQHPYRLVAELPAPVYINATPDGLLVEALRAAGKEPQERHLVWRPGQQPPEPLRGAPTVSAPLVYHILGHFKDAESVVLTQDDHFDFLIGASRNRALIPNVVRHALSSRTLLFLGFQLDDWSFRVLYRLIMSQAGHAQGRNLRFPHAAVQVDPESNQLVDPHEARKYLTERYGGDDISLYWGGPDDFLRDLAPRLPRRPPAEWDADDDAGDDGDGDDY